MTDPAAFPIKEAFRAELQRVLSGEFNAGTLKTLIQMAKAAQQFLMAEGLAAQGGEIVSDEDGEPNAQASYGGGMIYSPAGGGGLNNETFGAKMLREMITTLPALLLKQNETPEKLVAALAAAREAGLDDIADALKTKLIGGIVAAVGSAIAPAALAVDLEDDDPENR